MAVLETISRFTMGPLCNGENLSVWRLSPASAAQSLDDGPQCPAHRAGRTRRRKLEGRPTDRGRPAGKFEI